MPALNKENGVLLQTVTAVVSNTENSHKKKNARILFDKGSQKSFINQSLCDELNLKTQWSENTILKPFQGKNEKMRKLDIVNVCIADTKIQNLTDVELTVVPHICSPISGQTNELAQAMPEHLIDLPLANSTNGEFRTCHWYFDGDLYWKFFSGMLRRGLRVPVAEETSLGWVFSGCVGSLLGSSEFISTHILKLSEVTSAETETIHSSIHEKDHVLLGEVKKFWEVEDICDASSKSNHSFIHEKRFDSLQSYH